MSRIESLAILASPTGNDYLAERYGVVIDNVMTNTISAQLKNKDLSGDPDTGSVEAKRFVNSKANPYGTARSAGKGDKVKAKPVTVAIDNDDEIIEEVEQKDISLYGVEGLVERRTNNHQLIMGKTLEKEFFKVAATKAGVEFTTTETEMHKIVKKAIETVENIKNDFVDGVPRELLSVTLSTPAFGLMEDYFDVIPNAGNHNTQTRGARYYRGVRCFSSTDLPEGVDFILMIDGAVAQPVKVSVCNAEKIGLSDAYGFGVFFYHGCKEVMPDLILSYPTIAGDDDGEGEDE